jgi:hypothetical protein
MKRGEQGFGGGVVKGALVLALSASPALVAAQEPPPPPAPALPQSPPAPELEEPEPEDPTVYPFLEPETSEESRPVALKASGPPRPMWGVSLDLSGYGIRHSDEGYDLLGRRDDRTGVGLEASYDAWHFGRAGRVALGAGFVYDQVGPSNQSGDLQASFEGTSYYAVALARWRQDRALQPYLSLAGGVTRAQLSVENVSFDRNLHGQAYGGFGRAGAGVRLMPQFLIIKKQGQPMLGFTFTVELGATAGSKLSFDLKPEAVTSEVNAPAAGDPIATEAVRAGDLAATSLYARLGLGLAF